MQIQDKDESYRMPLWNLNNTFRFKYDFTGIRILFLERIRFGEDLFGERKVIPSAILIVWKAIGLECRNSNTTWSFEYCFDSCPVLFEFFRFFLATQIYCHSRYLDCVEVVSTVGYPGTTRLFFVVFILLVLVIYHKRTVGARPNFGIS